MTHLIAIYLAFDPTLGGAADTIHNAGWKWFGVIFVLGLIYFGAVKHKASLVISYVICCMIVAIFGITGVLENVATGFAHLFGAL